MLLQQFIDFRQIINSGTDGGDQDRISRKPGVERGHSVYLQSPLQFVQRTCCTEAQLDDRIPLPCMFFPGDQFVPIPFRDIRAQKNLLKMKVFLFDKCSYIGREGAVFFEDLLFVFRKESIDLLRTCFFQNFCQFIGSLLHHFIPQDTVFMLQFITGATSSILFSFILTDSFPPAGASSVTAVSRQAHT